MAGERGQTPGKSPDSFSKKPQRFSRKPQRFSRKPQRFSNNPLARRILRRAAMACFSPGKHVTESPREPTQPTSNDSIVDRARVESAYQEHAISLKRFLLGVLKDDAATADALHSTFIKLMEKGHLIEQESSLKSWLFRVAFNEAMLVKRRNATKRKHAESVAVHWQARRGDAGDRQLGAAVERITLQEDISWCVRRSTNCPTSSGRCWRKGFTKTKNFARLLKS